MKASLIAAALLASPALEQQLPSFTCQHADGTACTANDLGNPAYRQLLIFPTGFQDTPNDRAAFFAEVDRMVAGASQAGNVWTVQKSNQLLRVAFFVPGDTFSSGAAAFGGQVLQHPIRGYALTLDDEQVYQQVEALSVSLPSLAPFGVGVLFNDNTPAVTGNASPPSFTARAFGVAKFNRNDLDSGYTPAHALAHAALDFVDEYVENGLEATDVRTVDSLSPLLVFDTTAPPPRCDCRLSEILVGNGHGNVALSPSPGTVTSQSPSGQYSYEGGLFFGHGTFHMPGANLMGGNLVTRGTDDGFAYAHSPEQQHDIDLAFGSGTPRANDRLRNAGPANGWPLAFGSTTHVMLYDGDKLNHFQPTQRYQVQVGWYDRRWKTCWWRLVPYPCYDDVWTVAQKDVYPTPHTVSLPGSAVTSDLQLVLCANGLASCDATPTAANLVPPVVFQSPYEDTTVPATEWFATYYWHFRTLNGSQTSGWTAWSSFYRSL